MKNDSKGCITATSEMLNPQMPPVPPEKPREWMNEQQQRPAIGEVVTVSVMRKAKLVQDGPGSVRWELVQNELPIDLEQDAVFWLPEEK